MRSRNPLLVWLAVTATLVAFLAPTAFPAQGVPSEHTGEEALVSPLATGPRPAGGPDPGYYDVSEFMMGSVAVAVFLVESEGDAYDWTDAEANQTLGGIYAGLAWWASQEPLARLNFSYEVYLREPTTWEPIQNSLNDDYLWIDEILANRGYTEPDPWSKALHFNNDLRARLGTDWAFSLFVAYSDDAVNQGRFTNDQYAHAYFGGAWVTMSRFSSWAFNSADYYRAVPAHEMGHIFYATDEYDSRPPEYSGYLNCPDDNGAFGIMNRNNLHVSASTRCQIGWVDADENGVLDILDVPPETTLIPYDPDPTSQVEIVYEGTARVVPLTNRNPYGPGNDVTISRVTGVDLRVDGSPWEPAEPVDNAFDDFTEAFRLPVQGISFADPLPPFVTQASFEVTATAVLTPGTHQVEARAHNTEGNADSTPATDVLTNTEPTLAEVELWFSRQGGPYQLYGLDAVAPWAWTFDTGALGGDGAYRFFTRSRDLLGNYEPPPAREDAAALVDTQPPSLALTGPGEEWLATSSVTVTWTMSDAASGIAFVAVQMGGGPWLEVGNNTSHTFVGVTDGVHRVTVQVRDRAGLTGEASGEVRVDRGLPVLALEAPVEGSTVYSDTVTVIWQGTDATSGIARYEVQLDGGAVREAGTRTSLTFSGVGEGEHVVRVVAYDAAGNRAEVDVTFTVRHPGPGLLLVPPFLWIWTGAVAAALLILLWRKRKRAK